MKSIIEILSEGRQLPLTYDTWGWKVVRPDLTTYGGFVWPGRGKKLTATNPRPGTHVCPAYPGDGLCLAASVEAMSSVSYGSSTLLLVAYRKKNILASNAAKIRVSHVLVVDIIDFHRELRSGRFAYAHLSGANLSYADLYGAHLHDADLSYANLHTADLRGARLSNADLRGAHLYNADLYNADLSYANLHTADLRGANLYGANLHGAHLSYANLRGADLSYADLSGAVLPAGFNAVTR